MNESPEKILTEQEKFEYEYIEFQRLFPRLEISYAMPFEDLDCVLSQERSIFIKDTFTCYCYDDGAVPSRYIEIINRNGNITIRDVMQSLNDISFKRDCNHVFLEGFTQKTPIQYEMYFGS